MRLVDSAVTALEFYIAEQIDAGPNAERPEGARLLSFGDSQALASRQLLVDWSLGERAVQAKYLSGRGGTALVLDTRRDGPGGSNPTDLSRPETSYTRYSFLFDGADSLLVASEIANATEYPQAVATAMECGPFVRSRLPETIVNATPGTEIVGLDEFLALGRMIGARSLLYELNAA
jgi:hypothetical protein